MKKSTERRSFLKGVLALPALAALSGSYAFSGPGATQKQLSHKFKLSLNLYSFNTPLREGQMDLFDILEFCARRNFDAIDPTGYYFPGYPEVPPDAFVHRFKRKAFLLGLDISGTGIRNDFADPDPEKRQADIEHIRNWIEVAAKLGSPNLRLFAGHHKHEGHSREEVLKWMVKDIKACCEYGKQSGVMIALQNHNGFLKTADEVDELFERVDSEWLGLNLDIGSYRQNDPYEEIQKNIGRAVTWQIKENVWVDGKEVPVDLAKLFTLIEEAGYRGYLPLETLGEGNPQRKVAALLQKVRTALLPIR